MGSTGAIYEKDGTLRLCIDYRQLNKANIVANALSKKSIVALRSLNARFSLTQDGAIMVSLQVKPSLLQQVQEGQKLNEKLMTLVGQIQKAKESEYEIKGDGYLYHKGRICVFDDGEIKKSIPKEAHNSFHAMHPKSTKTYQDLKAQYWWPGIKKDIVDYGAKCLIC
ncbi:uncharacterized protein LOC131175848 [Hevea brasiliensis]|uniref:uncharacterized protein LOC131175848 n=1 Tax=Hevea brasiliensis TaxID=3981 RepID=UPI0025D04B5A|nr:uncharacterized protein LOC131175848 [Hevea brasiliensis]